MRNYLSPSMKPSIVITNQKVLALLDVGPVPKGLKKRAKPVTRKYIDGQGKPRYVGTSHLKKSQTLSCIGI